MNLLKKKEGIFHSIFIPQDRQKTGSVVQSMLASRIGYRKGFGEQSDC